MSDDRLFVPLSSEPFGWFASGSKTWELRRYAGRFSERHVWPGRRVELRRGYADGRSALWGTIRTVVQAPSIREFFARVPFEKVIPTAASREAATEIASAILRVDPDAVRVIGFEVEMP